jgi:predicted RNase H-like HicB family nuclease
MFTVVYVEARDGSVLAYVPEVPGAHAQGKNEDEALLHLRDALTLTLRANRRRTAALFAGLRELRRGTIEE